MPAEKLESALCSLVGSRLRVPDCVDLSRRPELTAETDRRTTRLLKLSIVFCGDERRFGKGMAGPDSP